jgi:hypothetical protein
MTFDATAFAQRPVRPAVAMKIAFCLLAATIGLAAGKAVLAKSQEAPAVTRVAMALATPVAEPAFAPQIDAARETCREVQVEIDDGYGVRGHVARWVCRKAL